MNTIPPKHHIDLIQVHIDCNFLISDKFEAISCLYNINIKGKNILSCIYKLILNWHQQNILQYQSNQQDSRATYSNDIEDNADHVSIYINEGIKDATLNQMINITKAYFCFCMNIKQKLLYYICFKCLGLF